MTIKAISNVFCTLLMITGYDFATSISSCDFFLFVSAINTYLYLDIRNVSARSRDLFT